MNNATTHSLIALLLAVSVSGQSHADGSLTTQFQINIIDNTCKIVISDGGQVHLGIVSDSYLQSLTPTQYSGGTHFSIAVSDCGQSITRQGSALHFTFRPQSLTFPQQTRQVFPNDTANTAGGAQNVGVVIFNDATLSNVLDSDGSSDVIFSASKQNYQSTYNFTARMQQTDADVTPGNITSNVLVDVYYD
jgi:type 1 fimbria pilin